MLSLCVACGLPRSGGYLQLSLLLMALPFMYFSQVSYWALLPSKPLLDSPVSLLGWCLWTLLQSLGSSIQLLAAGCLAPYFVSRKQSASLAQTARSALASPSPLVLISWQEMDPRPSAELPQVGVTSGVAL